MPVIKYGLEWPDGTSEVYMDLVLAKHYREEPYSLSTQRLPPGEHLLKAARALFTQEEFAISAWTEQRARAWCEEDFIVNLGAASCGKSNDFGCFAVLDWITDPGETYIAMATTSLEMLKVRTFGAVSRYFGILQRGNKFVIPGKLTGSLTRIVMSDDDDPSGEGEGVKASIRGVALSDGDEGKAIAKLAGAHLPYVTIILDEGSALPAAAAKARTNARAGARRFRFVSLANPISRTDESARFAEPPCGWQALDEYETEWRSSYGIVLHNHAELSPGIAEPEKYPFLPNATFLRDALQDCAGNKDDQLYWTMARGLPKPDSGENSVASRADFEIASLSQPGDEFAAYGTVAGLDPAFSSGGDACMLFALDVGVRGRYFTGAVRRRAIRRIPISSSSPLPATYQAVRGAVAVCQELGIALSDIAIDDSGTQSVADVWEMETGFAPIRENFGASAKLFEGGLFLNNAGKSQGGLNQNGYHRHGNRVTEMYAELVRAVRTGHFARFESGQGGVLGTDAENQFCRRRFVKDSTPLRLEPKREYKARSGGKSPDEADSAVLALSAAVARFGFDPQTGGYPSRRFGEPVSGLGASYGSDSEKTGSISGSNVASASPLSGGAPGTEFQAFLFSS